MNRRRRIFVAAPPQMVDSQGGSVWAIRQYGLGLEQLGHEVRVGGQDDIRDRDYDIVINISGTLDPEAVAHIPVRVYLDLDPGFNQFWHEDGIDRRFEGH